MKGDRWGLKFPPENRRQQMLSRVLLHVIEPAFPIDLSLDVISRGKRFAHKMPHRALLVFLHLFNWDVKRYSVMRTCTQLTLIEWLSAARWVEGCTIQRQLPHRFSIAAREFADVGYGSGKCPDK
jgi:hypothetical protein